MKRLLDAWIDFSAKRYVLLSIVGLVIFLLSTYLSVIHFKVDPKLEALLPKDSPALAAMKETQKRFGSTDMFTLAIQGKTPQQIAEIQDQLLVALKNWDDVVSAQAERSQQFFSDHALYYMPDSELVKIKNALGEQRDALQDYNPLLADLMGPEYGPPKANYKPDPELPKKLGLPDEAAASFKKFLGDSKSAADTSKVKEHDPKAKLPDSLASRLIGITKDSNWVGVVQCVLKKPSSDIDYVKTVLKRSKIMLDSMKLKYPGTRIEVAGPYKDLEEVDNLESNGLIATFIAVGLTFLIIAVFFRSLGPVKLIVYQAFISCAMVLALSFAIFGKLNLYTVFVIAILFGAGTNYPIFLLGYAQNLVSKGHDWVSALKETYHSLFVSLLIACTTIAAGMLVLLVAKFEGFFEFGVLGAIGIILSMVMTMLFLPAHILILDKITSWQIGKSKPLALFTPRHIENKGWMKWFFRLIDLAVLVVSLWALDGLAMALAPSIVWDLKGTLGVIVAVLALIFAVVVMFYLVRARNPKDLGTPWEKRLNQGAGITIVMTVIIACFIPFKDFFEYDFSKLREIERGPVKHNISVGAATGSSRSSSQPVVALANDPRTIAVLHDTLLARWASGQDTYLRGFLTIRSFAPDYQLQVQRAPLIKEISEILADSVFDLASGSDSAQVAQLRQMSSSSPFKIDEMPTWTLDLVRERSGEVGRIGFIYGRFNSSDAREAEEFQKRYGPCIRDEKGKQIQGICLEGVPQANLFSSSFIYAEVVHYVRQDSVKIVGLMIINLVVLLALLLRDWRRTVICLIGMVVGGIWTIGLMGALGQKVNVFNLIALSDLQAVAVESVSYLILEFLLLGRMKIKNLLGNIGMLVAICELTTLAGYAGMLFTSHQGIMSIGSFAVIGLASFLVTSMGLTPWLSTKLLDQQVKEQNEHN